MRLLFSKALLLLIVFMIGGCKATFVDQAFWNDPKNLVPPSSPDEKLVIGRVEFNVYDRTLFSSKIESKNGVMLICFKDQSNVNYEKCGALTKTGYGGTEHDTPSTIEGSFFVYLKPGKVQLRYISLGLFSLRPQFLSFNVSNEKPATYIGNITISATLPIAIKGDISGLDVDVKDNDYLSAKVPLSPNEVAKSILDPSAVESYEAIFQ